MGVSVPFGYLLAQNKLSLILSHVEITMFVWFSSNRT